MNREPYSPLKKNIIFIKFGELSHVNNRILSILEENFSTFEIVKVDIWEELLKRPICLIISLIQAMKYYGLDIIRRNKDVKDSLMHTPYGFRISKAIIESEARKHYAAFSFQTQSFFDGNTGNCPHFLYTDHTHLSNLKNPYYSKSDLWSSDWIELEREIYKSANINFVYSDNIGESIRNDYHIDQSKIIKAYVGCNTSFDNAPPSLDVERYERQQIVFVGVAWERKGGPELAKAFDRIKPRYPSASLHIVGCSPKIFSERVVVHGKVDLKTVKRILSESSIFCMPTKNEPFGIAYIEAMQNGLPIIATNIEALPEIVDDPNAGILISLDCGKTLEKALIELLNNPKRCSKMAAYGYRKSTQLYSWINVSEIISNEIRRTISQTSLA